VTKIEDWPTWLQWAVAVPNAVILLTLLGWTPKTKKGRYIALSLLVIEAIFFIFFQNWNSK
jgi:ABC-type branched-subunit amino acid transport system permease subunit